MNGVTLRNLDVGQRFIALNDKKRVKIVFEVLEKCKFNSGHGTSTRNCKNLLTNEIVSKSCNLKVIVKDPNLIATK